MGDDESLHVSCNVFWHVGFRLTTRGGKKAARLLRG